MSAVDRNFKAKASSRKPNTTFTVFNQPPDFGNPLSQPGKAAKSMNGKESAKEKPNMVTAGPSNSPDVAALTKAVPINGPVQEKLTKDKVKAMKKMPNRPPFCEASSLLFTQDEGKVSSNAPKKLMAKTTNKAKKKRLNQGFVARAFKALLPNITVIKIPMAT